MGAYFGALGFTKPLEKLVFHAMPLQSLLDWLSKPKGPNLVEASAAAAPDKALVLAVTKWMLYGEEPPLVGVGLVYKPHYISTEPFSATYMHLHVWHAAGSSVESEDKLNSSRLIFVNISEMSDVIPVAAQHPVLLDVATKETMMRTSKPMAPLYFRGFRLHTVWTQQPGGDLVHQIAYFMEGLTRKLLAHTSRVWELVRVPKLAEEEVAHQVLVGLATDQPLKANFFPGILEGVAGRLGLVPPGVPDPSTSAGAGMS